MKRQEKKVDELDTETTFADMNIEGFRWYDPSKKKNGAKKSVVKLTKKEYWAMVRGAFSAMLPTIGIILCVFFLMFLLAYMWLK